MSNYSSGAEVQSHLYVALDQAYITRDLFDKIYAQAEKVSKMDSGFIKYLNSQLKKPYKPDQPNKPKELKQLNKPNKLNKPK